MRECLSGHPSQIVLESLAVMKRPGTDMILTYYALDVARWLFQG
jgi:delta-aminolevulinic acid dehydratase/porphobilinogen synthase